MERDSSVKRLDFDDVSLTLSNIYGPAAAPANQSEGNDTLPQEISSPAPVSSVDLPDLRFIEECRQEAQRIRQNLISSDTLVSDFSHPFQQKVQREADAEDASAKQLKNVFSMLGEEHLELSIKEGILKRLAEWKIGDEKNEDGNWLTNDIDPDNMGDELTALRNANAETILEIESLIRTIASDVSGLETDLSTQYGCLDAFDLEADKLEAEQRSTARLDNTANGQSIVLSNQSENLQDLESTIRHLEETLIKNEKEYAQAEAAMETRIEQYNLEIEELQEQASELDREEECMRMLIDVTAREMTPVQDLDISWREYLANERFLQSQKHMECSHDVSVVSAEDGCLNLRLTTYVRAIDHQKDVTDQGSNPVWEHNLHIKINQETMDIEEAKLTPEDVPIDDLLSAAQEKCTTTESLQTAKEEELAEFGPQLALLVRAVHDRLTIHASKVATLSGASSDPRYRVEHVPGSPVITVTKPGKLKVLVEVPDNWPLPGCPLRLRSLDSLDTDSDDAASLDAMKLALEVANKMPVYVRHDLLTFIQAVEQIVSR